MRVAIFAAADNVHALEVAALKDVFMEANKQSGSLIYDIPILTEGPGPIVCSGGTRVLPDGSIETFDQPIDTLIIAGTNGPPPPPSEGVVSWIQKQARTARRYGSVCTGAFFLGAAGLIDGHHVTTHWEYAPDLALAYPAALVEGDQIFVREGPLFTSAGSTAAIDLALTLVEEDLGRPLSLAVARRLVVFMKRPGGQTQFSTQLAAQVAASTPIERAQAWIRDHLGQDLSVKVLADRAGMSERNFARAFAKGSGMTPGEFVERTRIGVARFHLEETNLPVQRIAIEIGFSGAEALRRAFRRRLGVTPADYRDRFRTTSRG